MTIRRYLCLKCGLMSPAIVEWDDSNPIDTFIVTPFNGIEPHSTIFFPGEIFLNREIGQVEMREYE